MSMGVQCVARIRGSGPGGKGWGGGGYSAWVCRNRSSRRRIEGHERNEEEKRMEQQN